MLTLCSPHASRFPALQYTRVWIPDAEEVWKSAEIVRDYKEGESVLHIKLENESVMLPLHSLRVT